MSLRIVHVVHWLKVAGLENGVVNLVNALGDDLVQTVVCVREAGALSSRLPSHVEVIVVGRRDDRDIGLIWRLARVFRRIRPQIVHSRNWSAIDAVPAARLARVPIVVHGEHGRDAANPDGLNRRRNLIRWMLSPFVNRFVTVSDDLRRWLVATVGISAEKIVCIPNGVNTARFSPVEEGSSHPRAARRSALGLPAHATVIGTVGRFDPVKDQMTLLEAFARLEDVDRRLALVLVGEGPLRTRLEARIRKPDLAGRVHLMGERADVPAVLHEFDVFVLPSIAEGMSNTILEAMATGLPVVATRTGGNPELVEDGVTGVLVPVRDPWRVAAALTAYLGDAHLRFLHGKAGRQRAVELFSLGQMAGAYRNLYGSLAAAQSEWRA